MKWLSEKPWTTLFVDGNHENFDRLKNYPITEEWGGKVQKIYDKVYHLMRGEIYTDRRQENLYFWWSVLT